MKLVVRTFDEIPGPRGYPLVGTLLSYLPVVGKYRFDQLHRNGLKKYREFGEVVKEEIVPGAKVIWIFAPEDVQELFRREGRHPQRRSHLALSQYRLGRRDLYNSAGLLPTNGPEWYRLRTVFQKGLILSGSVRSYLPVVNEVIEELVGHIGGSETGVDYLQDLSRAYLEMLGLVAFDHRLRSFSEEELRPESRSSRLMQAVEDINSCILKTDNGPGLWRYWETPLYRKLRKAHEYMESVAVELVKAKGREMKKRESRGGGETSLLEMYLRADEIDIKDVVGMSSDMLLAGIDTITYTTAFILYHLATNRSKQEELHEESKRLLPRPDTPVTPEVLAEAEYLKAVLKESYRLNPVSVGIGRVLAEDAIFSGYHVPKGNIVVTQNQVSCRLEKYFSQAERFHPERWLRGSKEQKNINPYLVLPFGHGPRSCIARRLAEQNMQTLVLKVCRNFEITWWGKTLDSKSHLINKPDGPLKFAFKRRSS